MTEIGQAERPSPYTTDSNIHVHKAAPECLSVTTAFHAWPGSQACCCPFQYFQLFPFNSQSRHALIKHVFPLRNLLHGVTAQKANILTSHHLLGPLSLHVKLRGLQPLLHFILFTARWGVLFGVNLSVFSLLEDNSGPMKSHEISSMMRSLFLMKTHAKQLSSPDLLQNLYLDQKSSSRMKIISSCLVHTCMRLKSQCEGVRFSAAGSQHQHFPDGSQADHQCFFQITSIQLCTRSLCVTRCHQQRQLSPRADVPQRVGSQSSLPEQSCLSQRQPGMGRWSEAASYGMRLRTA